MSFIGWRIIYFSENLLVVINAWSLELLSWIIRILQLGSLQESYLTQTKIQDLHYTPRSSRGEPFINSCFPMMIFTLCTPFYEQFSGSLIVVSLFPGHDLFDAHCLSLVYTYCLFIDKLLISYRWLCVLHLLTLQRC